MKYKISIVMICIVILYGTQLHANIIGDIKKGVIGISTGINHHGYFSGDIYYGFYPSIFDKSVEVTTGYAYFGNSTKFDNFDKIVYVSHGLFLEANFFTNPYFFFGGRMAYDGNFVIKSSQIDYTSAIGKKPPLFFLGKTFLGNIGLNLPVAKKIDFRLSGQAGVHNYTIQTGWQIGNSNSPFPDQFRDTHAKELQLKLIANIKGALLIRF